MMRLALVCVLGLSACAAPKSSVELAHARGLTVWGHVPRIDGRADALRHAVTAGLDVIAHAEEVFFTALYGDVERQYEA